MDNSVLIGLSRQMALKRELEVVANNIANLSTTGYKADGNIFQEYVMPQVRAEGFTAGDARVSFVLDRNTWHDFGQGPINHTGNTLDVAVDGTAFLVVQTPRGERYTRNGALHINAAGELVTTEGFSVLGEAGPIQFQQNDRGIVIGRDGSVAVQEGLRGKLRLVDFASRQSLRKDGGSTFMAAAGTQPEPATNSTVIQGALEGSNVRGVLEMARMIEVTRSYTSIATMLQQHGDIRRNAIQQLADVPA